MAKLTEMQHWVWTLGKQGSNYYAQAWIIHGEGHFAGHTWHCPGLPVVNKLTVICKGPAAMRTLAANTVATC